MNHTTDICLLFSHSCFAFCEPKFYLYKFGVYAECLHIVCRMFGDFNETWRPSSSQSYLAANTPSSDVITCKLYLCAVLTFIYFVASTQCSFVFIFYFYIVNWFDVGQTERQDNYGNIKMANRYAFCCCCCGFILISNSERWWWQLGALFFTCFFTFCSRLF